MAFHPISLVYLSEVQLRNGDLGKASSTAERAAQLTFEYRQHAYHAWALHMLGEVFAHPAHFSAEAAEARYVEAIRSAIELGMRPLVAHCRAGLAGLYARMGKREQAEDHLTAATTIYRRMGMTYWLEKAEREMRELT